MQPTYEISGDEFVARQTRSIMENYRSSRPRPRESRMGFWRPRNRSRGGSLPLEEAIKKVKHVEAKNH